MYIHVICIYIYIYIYVYHKEPVVAIKDGILSVYLWVLYLYKSVECARLQAIGFAARVISSFIWSLVGSFNWHHKWLSVCLH